MNKEEFLNASLNQISQVYSGKRDCCRCGCKGNYVSTSFSIETNSDINDKLAERRLKRGKQLIAEGAEFDLGGTYIDIKTGEDRSLTFYFDDIKKEAK